MINIEYRSQHGQDKFVVDYFNRKKKGTFIDIGAHDGVTLSNTYILEKVLEWTGICIEPMQHQYQKLIKERSCKTYDCAVYDEEGTQRFTLIEHDGYPDMLSGISKDMTFKQIDEMLSECNRIGASRKSVTVQTRLLSDIMDENNLTYVDFLTIDTEGAERKILESIDYDKYSFGVIMYENGGKSNDVRNFLLGKGYQHKKKLGPDDVFTNVNML